MNSDSAIESFLKSTSVNQILDEERKSIIKKREVDGLHNRVLMTRLIDILLFLVKGGLAFRGHNETKDSFNHQGNFKELVKLLSKYDSILNTHLENGKQNVQYLSNRIQNGIITSIHTVLLKKVKFDLENTKISIIVDETSDIEHHEQLSIVNRYFDSQKNRRVETLIGLKRMSSVNAESIFNMLTSVLQQFSKDWSTVLAVCFDGASTMSGSISGLQARCKRENNTLFYIHCYAQCLNLALIDSICEKSNTKSGLKNSSLTFDFLGTVQFVYSFLENSPIRHAVLENIAK